MSYCRFSDQSDVYLYGHIKGGIVCCSCRLGELKHAIYDFGPGVLEELNGQKFTYYDDVKLRTRGQALKHLQKHLEKKHKFPKYAIERLEKEIKKLKNNGKPNK